MVYKIKVAEMNCQDQNFFMIVRNMPVPLGKLDEAVKLRSPGHWHNRGTMWENQQLVFQLGDAGEMKTKIICFGRSPLKWGEWGTQEFRKQRDLSCFDSLFASCLLCVGLWDRGRSGCSEEGCWPPCLVALYVGGLQGVVSLWRPLQLWLHSCLHLHVLPSSEARLWSLQSQVTAPIRNIYISTSS